MEARQSRFSLWAARRACGNGGATTGENQGLPSRTKPKGATRAKVRTSGGVSEAIIRYFRKGRVKLETSCPCWRRLFGPAFDLSPLSRLSPSLSLSGEGAQKGGAFCLDGHARHGHLKGSSRRAPRPPSSNVQCSPSSVVTGHLVARLGR